MHHQTAFYNEEHFNRLLQVPRYINVFIMEPFLRDTEERHIFGAAHEKPWPNERFRGQKPKYRLVVKRKNFQ